MKKIVSILLILVAFNLSAQECTILNKDLDTVRIKANYKQIHKILDSLPDTIYYVDRKVYNKAVDDSIIWRCKWKLLPEMKMYKF